MGEKANKDIKEKHPTNITAEELRGYIKKFKELDRDSKGYISTNDLRRSIKV